MTMLANPQNTSSSIGRTSPIGVARQPKRPISDQVGTVGATTEKQQLWIPMLQSASKGKDLSEKQLILLGGTWELQREFLEQLNPKEPARQSYRTNNRRQQRPNIPISNKFALGYTYYDVLDADQEDVLARLNIHMLANPSGQLGRSLKPLLTSTTVKDTLVMILLDWSDPFTWSRQLRQWIRLLRRVILDLDEETKLAMEENMNAWKEKKVGPDAQSSAQSEVVAPPGPGEWDEALGIPLSVVCVQSEKTERLERELGWNNDHFDYLQQWLRTILVKHGGSLVYTASFEPNNLRTLLHTSLNIQSLLKRESVKHNIMDRDKVLVPPGWDSWGKIRILREGFDPEPISNAWSVEVQEAPEDNLNLTPPKPKQETEPEALTNPSSSAETTTSAVTAFELALVNPIEDNSTPDQLTTEPEITITATPYQEFLQTQSAILEKLKAEDAATERANKEAHAIRQVDSGSGAMSPVKTSNAFLGDSIGAHRVNVNGIDLDAEEATRRLRERENERNALRRAGSEMAAAGTTSGAVSPAKSTAGRTATGTGPEGTSTPSGTGADGKPSNEALHGFFANLIKKGEGRNRGVGSSVTSGTGSPRRESPAPIARREE